MGFETFLPGLVHPVALSQHGLQNHGITEWIVRTLLVLLSLQGLAKFSRHLCVLRGGYGYVALLARPEDGLHLDLHPSHVFPVVKLRQLPAPCVGCRKAGQEELSTPPEIYPAELPQPAESAQLLEHQVNCRSPEPDRGLPVISAAGPGW